MYYISRNYKAQASAAGKAKIDCEKVMEQSGFKNLGLERTTTPSSFKGFFLTLAGVVLGLLRLPTGSTLVLQYPTKKYYNFMLSIARLKKCKVITIIHDLRSHRKQKMDISNEMSLLNKNDVIITHNVKMSAWLRENGLNCRLVELEIFDYFNDSDSTENTPGKPGYNIIFAGQLDQRKNGFLYAIDSLPDIDYGFNLYGPGFDGSALPENTIVDYKGVFPASEIVSRIEGQFGLVWDGISVDECAGSFGEYLKINNPHKTSMYLRAGIPVIIWDQAAMAKYVLDNNAGLAVSSLADIKDALARLSAEDYAKMKENAEAIAAKVGSGFYLTTALEKAIAS